MLPAAMETPEALPPQAAPGAEERPAGPAPPRPRQQRLFPVANPFAERLGREFFRNLPETPGVYLYYDETGRLLYVGQSRNLRARVGSYRHVSLEHHPRRICRLVFRIARVEIRRCATAREAVELESELLRTLRPPFNRGGVWTPAPWHCRVESGDGFLTFHLSREAAPDGWSAGPLPSSFRHTLAALVRLLFRRLWPELPLSEFPHRTLHAGVPPLTHRLPLPDAAAPPPEEVAALVKAFLAGESGELVEFLAAAPPGENLPPAEAEFWAEQLEAVRKFHARRPFSAFPAPALPEPGGDKPLQPALPGFEQALKTADRRRLCPDPTARDEKPAAKSGTPRRV